MAGDRELVLATNKAFYRSFEKKDIEAMEAVWSKGMGCLCIHPGRDALKGWPDIREAWERIFKNTSYLEIDTDILTVEVSGDLAFVVLIENVLQISGGDAGTDRFANRRLEARSMATNGFERMAGQWYMTHHHGSPVVD
ncbi:nuclear transport factor 2 family protein [Nodosilinea sp. LEGE 07298]|jgi:ketosteroid isomerase-like protein|uniref:nuclear transport factor 2 family protein n=1 Tax=Nodosilinea sp. LEGE 07298 TaxID=2777970 RepID=UPI0018816B94|nr:nuclear transport factor 2 family protein [Nodosilinea sp. LEGE 07298]MBE9113142.1 nuclear transport factor 2 family protein [Nodosilinea sp. LEGE 07298]